MFLECFIVHQFRSQSYWHNTLQCADTPLSYECLKGKLPNPLGGACDSKLWSSWIVSIIGLSECLLILFELGFCIRLAVQLKMNGAVLNNAVGHTIISAIIGLPFFFLWHLYYGITVHLGSFAWQRAAFGIGAPVAGAFGSIAFLNLALMWTQVAESSRAMKKTGVAISGKFKIFVLCFSVLIFVMLVVLMSALEKYTYGALCVTVFLILIAVAYLCGSRKLATVMTGSMLATTGSTMDRKPARLVHIIRTARVTAGLILGGVASEAVFIVLLLRNPPSVGIRFVQDMCLVSFNTMLILALGRICIYMNAVTARQRNSTSAAENQGAMRTHSAVARGKLSLCCRCCRWTTRRRSARNRNSNASSSVEMSSQSRQQM